LAFIVGMYHDARSSECKIESLFSNASLQAAIPRACHSSRTLVKY